MPLPWTIALVVVVAAAVLARVLVPGLPRQGAVALTVGEQGLVGVGVVGLVAHCAAMFATTAVRALPGTGGYADAVNGMGVASALLYVAPALLLLLGLRRVPLVLLGILALLLVAVGLTMYDGGPLAVHLTALLAAVAGLAVVGATTVRHA